MAIKVAPQQPGSAQHDQPCSGPAAFAPPWDELNAVEGVTHTHSSKTEPATLFKAPREQSLLQKSPYSEDSLCNMPFEPFQ